MAKSLISKYCLEGSVVAAPPMALATREPPPFTTRLRLAEVSFPGGIGDAFGRAKGGAFAKVAIGALAGDPVAIKILLETGTARGNFQSEADLLLSLRSQVDLVRQLRVRGVPLGLDEIGAHHVAYALGTGEEPDLAALDRRLPHGRAFILAIEPLAQTVEEMLKRVGTPRLPLAELLRVAHETACALAFLARCNIVVWRDRCIHVFRYACIHMDHSACCMPPALGP